MSFLFSEKVVLCSVLSSSNFYLSINWKSEKNQFWSQLLRFVLMAQENYYAVRILEIRPTLSLLSLEWPITILNPTDGFLTYAISCFHFQSCRLQLIHIVSIAMLDLRRNFGEAAVVIPTKANSPVYKAFLR